jgi:hypothetical protein
MCTIIAKNYIAFARTLCASFLKHHPDGTCHVLIIDEPDGYIDASQENFELVRIETLKIPRLQEFCYKYNITELATAFKPYLLDYLFASTGSDNLLYLDPDILVTQSLNQLYDELNHHDVILTPHLDTDYPDDGCMPGDAQIMRAGIYNLGFIGLRKCENVQRFLAWWQHKLYDKCVIELNAGYFVDQKFIDLAVALFPIFSIIRDTGYNAAYWNIHSRKIHRINGTWMCNDGLLYFYHFSNYKPEKPEDISGHQNRFRLADLDGLAELFKTYNAMLKQYGYDTTRKFPYGYIHYTNGQLIHDSERASYRSKLPTAAVDNPFVLENHPMKFRIKVLKRNIKYRVKGSFKSLSS